VDFIFLDYQFENGINGDEIINNIQDLFGNKFIVLMSGWNEEEINNVVIKNRLRLRNYLKTL
jgi:hypothetical protein